MAVVVEVAGSDRLPVRPRSGAHQSTADYIRPVQFPDRGLASARVLPQDVGMAVVIEVAGSDRFPTRYTDAATGFVGDGIVLDRDVVGNETLLLGLTTIPFPSRLAFPVLYPAKADCKL
jgi:hypothetical protein